MNGGNYSNWNASNARFIHYNQQGQFTNEKKSKVDEIFEFDHKYNDEEVENDLEQDNANQMSSAIEADGKVKKAKTYDFVCTIFFAMVALLVFATVFRSYTIHTGGRGGCGSQYGIQPMLAYACVGLACGLIKSLRKQIKDLNNLKENTSQVTPSAETEKSVDPNDFELFKNTSPPTYPMTTSFDTMTRPLNTDSIDYFKYEPKTVSSVVERPYSGFKPRQLSSALQLPEWPSLDTQSIQPTQPTQPTQPIEVTADPKNTNLIVLSAADLKPINTHIDVKPDNQIESNHSNSDTSYRISDYNWHNYELNIDKYKF